VIKVRLCIRKQENDRTLYYKFLNARYNSEFLIIKKNKILGNLQQHCLHLIVSLNKKFSISYQKNNK
jgi:hypothetical protein